MTYNTKLLPIEQTDGQTDKLDRTRLLHLLKDKLYLCCSSIQSSTLCSSLNYSLCIYRTAEHPKHTKGISNTGPPVSTSPLVVFRCQVVSIFWTIPIHANRILQWKLQAFDVRALRVEKWHSSVSLTQWSRLKKHRSIIQCIKVQWEDSDSESTTCLASGKDLTNFDWLSSHSQRQNRLMSVFHEGNCGWPDFSHWSKSEQWVEILVELEQGSVLSVF